MDPLTLAVLGGAVGLALAYRSTLTVIRRNRRERHRVVWRDAYGTTKGR